MTIKYLDSKRISALSSDALVAHLKFNDNVTDSAGSNNGTVTGTTTYVAGKVGKAFSFNGSSYVTLANESNFDFDRTDSFSVSFWMKTSTSQDIKMLLGKSELNTTGWHVWLRQGSGSTGDIHFNLTNTDATNELEVRIQSLATFDDNWHHVVFTYDGTSDVTGVTGYFDNSVISNGTVSNTLTSSILNNLPVSIGDTPNGGARDYTGSMDDVRIYSRELDQSEVTMIYNSGNGTEETKPTNVQDNSILVEKDTGKRFIFDGGRWKRTSVFDSLHESFTNDKQRFVEYFSGKQLPSYWNVTAGGNGSGSMVDEIDGGFKLTTSSSSSDSSMIHFNNIRQFSPTSGTGIFTVKRNTAGQFRVGFASPYDLSSDLIAIADSSNIANKQFMSKKNGTWSTAINSSLSTDTLWHTYKIDLTSTVANLTTDGVFDVTQSVNVDSDVQPFFQMEGTSATSQIRYMECYNT